MPTPSVSRVFGLLASLFTALAAAPSSASTWWDDPLEFTAAEDTGPTVNGLSLPIFKLHLTPCGGGSVQHYTINQTVTLTNGLSFPQGSWCGIDIELSGDFTLSGLTPSGHALSITLAADTLSLSQTDDLVVNTSASTEDAVVELLAPDWYADEIAPYVTYGVPVTIGTGHARHAALVGSIEQGSALVITPH